MNNFNKIGNAEPMPKKCDKNKIDNTIDITVSCICHLQWPRFPFIKLHVGEYINQSLCNNFYGLLHIYYYYYHQILEIKKCIICTISIDQT